MISCIAVDIIDYDKPPASLAFLAGACEQAQQPYQCWSFNSAFLDQLNTHQYDEIYTKIKLDLIQELPQTAVDIIAEIIQQIKSSSSTFFLHAILYCQIFFNKIKNRDTRN